jgi:hypothetical protein
MEKGSKEKGKGQGGVRYHITSPASNCLIRVKRTMILGALLLSQSEFEAQMSWIWLHHSVTSTSFS